MRCASWRSFSMLITMPQLGESVTEGTVEQWLKKPGDAVEKYEPFVEVAIDKVTAEVPAPVAGIIREVRTAPTGAPIAVIDETGTAPAEEAVPALVSAGTPAAGTGAAPLVAA